MPSCTRYGIFETNSSSCHSLAMYLKSNRFIDDYFKSIPTLNITFKFYGTEEATLNNAEDKLNYLFNLAYAYGENKISPILSKEIIQNIFTEMLTTKEYDNTFSEYVPIFEYLREDCKNITNIIIDTPYGNLIGVDHQSVESIESFLCGIPMKDFIESPDYFVHLSSD